jgi:hypothetical protein
LKLQFAHNSNEPIKAIETKKNFNIVLKVSHKMKSWTHLASSLIDTQCRRRMKRKKCTKHYPTVYVALLLPPVSLFCTTISINNESFFSKPILYIFV